MSFLLAEDEHAATLEEALAFIESCSDASNGVSDSFDALSDHSSAWSVADATSSPSRSDDSDSSSLVAGDLSCGLGIAIAPRTRIEAQDENPAPRLRLRISREANTRAVHQYRMRTKNQILDLREEALQLSARVEQLKKRQEYVKKTTIDRHISAHDAMREQSGASTALQSSLELAVVEYRKRQEAETLNRKLKHALEKQSKMNKILETFFQRQLAKHDLDSVLQVEKKQLFVVSLNDAPIFQELLSYVGGVMQSMVPSATAAINTNDPSCAFNNSLMKQDPMLGQVFEVVTNTPLPCSRRQLETTLLAHVLGFDERNAPSKVLHYTGCVHSLFGAQSNQPNASSVLVHSCFAQQSNGMRDTRFTLTFGFEMAGSRVNGMSACQSFVQLDRTVMTYTSLLLPQGSGLLFRESIWFVMSGSGELALLQSCYRLHLERRDPSAAASAETANLHRAIMNGQSEKMRGYQLGIQSMLLRQLDSIATGGRLGACSLQIRCEE